MSLSSGLALERCFRILEVFAKVRRPMRAIEIQDALDCPKSSLTILLRGMNELGYIHYDTRNRIYFPSLKVQAFGDWILPTITRGPQLQSVVRDLRNKADETAVISVKAGNYLEVAIVETGSQPISLQLPTSSRFDLWGTAVGTAYFMSQKDAEIKKAYMREDTAVHDKHTIEDILDAVKKARTAGYAIAYGSVSPDLAALACPLQIGGHGPTTVLSVGGPVRRVRANKDRLVSLLMESANKARANLTAAKPFSADQGMEY